MWNRDISIDILVYRILEDIKKIIDSDLLITDFVKLNNLFSESIYKLKLRFPHNSDEEILEIFYMMYKIYNVNKSDDAELVITAPASFKIKARKTAIVVNELINNAKNEISITGYSISEYVGDILDIIIKKSMSGVYVNLYINDLDSKDKILKDILMYKGKYLNVYNYNKEEDDKMAALHAKVIVIDSSKVFITSSNLSYHGMVKNIEMGVLINSKAKSAMVNNIFIELRKRRILNKQ